MTKEQKQNNNKFTSNVYKLLGYKDNISVVSSELTDEEIADAKLKLMLSS